MTTQKKKRRRKKSQKAQHPNPTQHADHRSHRTHLEDTEAGTSHQSVVETQHLNEVENVDAKEERSDVAIEEVASILGSTVLWTIRP